MQSKLQKQSETFKRLGYIPLDDPLFTDSDEENDQPNSVAVDYANETQLEEAVEARNYFEELKAIDRWEKTFSYDDFEAFYQASKKKDSRKLVHKSRALAWETKKDPSQPNRTLEYYIVRIRVYTFNSADRSNDDSSLEDLVAQNKLDITTRYYFARYYINASQQEWAMYANNKVSALEYDNSETKAIQIDINTIPKEQKSFLNLKMLSSNLVYKLFDGRDISVQVDKEENCLLAFLYSLNLHRNKETIRDYFGMETTVAKLIQFSTEYNLRLTVLNPMMEIIVKEGSENRHRDAITLLLNGEHAHGLNNDIVLNKIKNKLVGEKVNLNEFSYDPSYDYSFTEDESKALSSESHVVYYDGDMDSLLRAYVSKTNNINVGFRLGNKHVSAFSADNHVYVQANEYTSRKIIWEKLGESTGGRFKQTFINQSWLNIGETLMLEHNIRPPHCHWNTEAMGILDKYFTKPLVYHNEDHVGLSFAVDIVQCYLQSMKRLKYIPVACVIDEFKPFDENTKLNAGFYLTNEWSYRGMRIPGQIYTKDGINAMLKRGMPKSNIIAYLRASYCYNGAEFEEMCDEIEGLITQDSSAKNIYKQLTGWWGRRFKRNDEMCVIEGEETLISMGLADIMAGYQQVVNELDKENNIFLYRRTKQHRLTSDHMGLYCSIITDGYVQLLEMIDSVDQDVVGVKTDCVVFEGQKPDTVAEGYRLCDVPTTHNADYPEVQFEYNSSYKLENFHVISGEAGSGKTFALAVQYGKLTSKKKGDDTPAKNPVILSHMNKPLNDIRENYGIQSVMTVDSFFKSKERDSFDVILVDEYSMVPCYNMNRLYTHCLSMDIPCYLYGDDNQIPAVKDLDQKYLDEPVFGRCLERTLKSQNRYDKDLKDFLQYFLEHRKINWELYRKYNKARKKIKCKRAIAWRNKTCSEFNDTVKKNNDNDLAITIKTHKGRCVNSQVMKVRDLPSGLEFGKDWVYAYCITAHRSQGMTIREHHKIFELEKMSFEMAYVVLSRATSLAHIHINGWKKLMLEDKEFVRIKRRVNKNTGVCPHKLRRGYVYLLYNKVQYYIGETIDMKERHEQHKLVFGDEFKMKELCSICFVNKAELRMVEESFINTYTYEYKGKAGQLLNKKQVYKPQTS